MSPNFSHRELHKIYVRADDHHFLTIIFVGGQNCPFTYICTDRLLNYFREYAGQPKWF